MFFRKKPNKSSKVSVQVIQKVKGRYTVAKTIGSSAVETEIKNLFSLGEEWIRNYRGVLDLPINQEEQLAESVLENVENITVAHRTAFG